MLRRDLPVSLKNAALDAVLILMVEYINKPFYLVEAS